MSQINIFDIHKNEHYRESIVSALNVGIPQEYSIKFNEMMLYFISKLSLFNIPEFLEKMYEDEDDVSDIILPSFRRVFGKVYIEPPTILSTTQLELFREYFNIDYFIDYLIKIYISSKGCLDKFEYIDRTIEHLTLIVDNYIASLVKRTRECKDYKEEIRNLKLNRLVND